MLGGVLYSDVPRDHGVPTDGRARGRARRGSRTLLAARGGGGGGGGGYEMPISPRIWAVVDRLLTEDERASDAATVTVTVLRDPTLNAFALPTGHIFVHTGLLARVENESQLAAVLARELSHVSLRHGADQRPGEPRGADVVGRSPGRWRGDRDARGRTRRKRAQPRFRTLVGQSLAVAYAAAVDVSGIGARAADAGSVELLPAPTRRESPFYRSFGAAPHARRPTERLYYTRVAVAWSSRATRAVHSPSTDERSRALLPLCAITFARGAAGRSVPRRRGHHVLAPCRRTPAHT